jgi:molecular chaperone DnaK (HSP70)
MFESDGATVTGQMAASKLYERQGSDTPVLNPSSFLKGNSLEDTYADLSIVEETISSCARNALERVIGGNHSKSGSLFSIDVNATGGFNVQPVFAYPPSPIIAGEGEDDAYLQLYQEKAQKLAAPSAIATFIQEPVCAITAAQNLKVIPISGQGPVMLFDIGDKVTSISLVEEESKKIIHHTKLDGFGGETLVQALVEYISKSFYGSGYAGVSDKMGVQRLFDASRDAVFEISSGGKTNHGRVQVNVPYLSVDEKMQPKHLNMGISAKVLESEFTELVASRVSSEYADQNVLSTTIQKPADLEGLFTSMIMKVLESSGVNPFALGPILVIGGGARSPILQKAIKNALSNLAGDQYTAEKLVIPKDEMIEELVVLGASMMTE